MLLVISIILSSYAFALIQVDGPTRTTYNIGDRFPIAGFVEEDNAVSGFLKLMVICEQQEFPLQLVPVSLLGGEQKTFKELNVPQITISASMNGLCFIKASLITRNQTLATGESKTFQATKELEGSFIVEEPRIQIGKSVEISGTVLKKDGSGVSGNAEIYFSQEGQRFLVDATPFNDGLFNYTYQTRAIPAGAYSIDIVTRDVYGNEMVFLNAANFYLSNKLEVRLHSDKVIALPGDILKLSGQVMTVLNEPPTGASLEIILDFLRFTESLKEGNFEAEIQLPKNIRSGKHDLTANAVDTVGNSGSDGIKIDVTPIATTLILITDKQKYLPRESLGITVQLLDQGSDPINTLVSLEISDPDDEIRTSTDLQTNKLETFRVPDFAKPGVWEIRSSIKSLSQKTTFEILEVKELETKIKEETLYIRNIGNVKHTGKITVLIDDGKEQYKAVSWDSIGPNETVAIELNKYASNGEYSVSVQLPDKESTSISNPENNQLVTIKNGKKSVNLNALYAVLVAALAFVLLYMSLLKPSPLHRFERRSKYEHEFKAPSHRPRRHSEPVMVSEKEDSVRDFRERILRDIKKTEEEASRAFRNKRGGLGGAQGSSSGSAFANMFG